jgi:hypothetical protein
VRSFTRGAAASTAVTLLGLGLQSAAPLASASCDGQECDPHWVDYGCVESNVSPSDACCAQGHMQDKDHWETTLQSADWLPFQSNEFLRLHIGAWTGTRQPDQFDSAILIAPAAPEGPDAPFPDVDPTDAPVDNATLATGNLGEFDKLAPGMVVVQHATCSASLVRVIVGFPSIEGGVPEEYIGPCQRH